MIAQTISHYRIIRKLGAGGMGEVFLAEDSRLDRQVAVKILPAAFSTDAGRLRRFEQEARATSALNHPNILTLHDFGTHESAPFLVMELLDGEDLRAQLRRGPLPPRTAVDYAGQIAAGLAAAHEKGIIHRDLKPENLFITRDGRVKILDFGLAKLIERRDADYARRNEEADTLDLPAGDASLLPSSGLHLTDPGRVMGTMGYMSPEQVRGENLDARSDIFSLGIVLYEMLTGRSPFAGVNVFDRSAAILEREPPPLSHHLDAVPAPVVEDFQRVVSKALSKDREERYRTPVDLLQDLYDLKEELAFSARLERTSRTGSNRAITGPTGNLTAVTGAPATVHTDARGRAGAVNRRRLTALLVLLILIAAAAVASLYRRQTGAELPIDSVAVLPFTNPDQAEESDYLADGLTESIINNLTQLSDLRVIARSSVFQYKGRQVDPLRAGRDLGVRAVVIGRVQQRGDSLMINAELVDVRENKQLWGQQYNRRLTDVFALQGEIAAEISRMLRARLSGAERQRLAKRPTENLKAFQYYMQGWAMSHRRTREDLFAAVRYYQRALEEDDRYALAYAGLANAYASLGAYGFIAPSQGRSKAEEAARQALALDDGLAEAHTVLGQINVLFTPYNFTIGDRELQKAIELRPGLALAHWYLGISLIFQGRLDESLDELLKARELDPLSPVIARSVAIPYYFRRDSARALELLRQADELGPPFGTTFEIGVYIQNRLFDETLAELEKAGRERKGDPILIYSTGMIYAARGEPAAARRIIRELEAMSGESLSQAHWIAKIYATLKEREEALSWLQRGLTAGAIGSFYKDEPVWDPIRDDARFGELLRRMGLQP